MWKPSWKQHEAKNVNRRTRRRSAITGVAALTTAAALVVAGCSPSNEKATDPNALDYFGYQLPVPLVTTNAASNLGDSMKVQRLSGRVFPGAFIPGPSGQRIPNTDLVSTQVLPGQQRQVVYTLTDQAVFSLSLIHI